MRKLKNWEINKRLYNIKRNENLICLGALLDLDTFNKIKMITSQRGISNLEYIRECYKLVKQQEIEKLRLETEGIEYDNEEVLNLCSRLKLHTIIPTIKIGNYPYSEIKKKLKSQEIVSIPINSITNTQLPVVIDYIKQKGYEFVKLNDLLSESIEK